MKKNHKTILKVLLGIIVIALGYRMFSLWQQEQLWGYIPLFFFVALWGLTVLLFEKKYSNGGATWNRLGWSTLAGILLSLGFPPIPLTILMFVGFVPLLFVEDEIAKVGDGKTKGEVFKYAYHTFVTWNILTTWWVANTAFFAAFIAIWLNSFFMAIPFVLYHLVKKYSPKLAGFGFVAFWLAFEMIHLRWEISWTWLNLGNAFAEFPSWVQWYEYTGTFGGTFWVLAANLLIYNILKKHGFSMSSLKFPKIRLLDILKIVGFIGVPIIASLIVYSNYEEKGREVEIGVVQPNYEPHYEKFNASERERLQRFIKLSEEAIRDSTSFLVFPETSFNSIDFDGIEFNRDVQSLSRFLRNHPDLNLVTGISGYNIFQDGEPHSKAVREAERGGKPLFYEVLNAATQVAAFNRDYPIYVKSKLVPGAEFIPYRQLFFWVEPLVKHLEGSFEGHGTQEKRAVFESKAGKIAPVICYESIYGEYHAEYIKAGGEAIFIMTNDGWWDNSAGHKQHLKFASLRAIETRRAVARSANTGVSCFLNQRGDILQATDYGVEAAINGKIRFNDELTFYVKFGDQIGKLGILISVLLILNLLVKRLKK